MFDNISDFWLLFIFSILAIILSYLLGLQVGYKRGHADGLAERVIITLNKKYGLNPLDTICPVKDYNDEEDSDADI